MEEALEASPRIPIQEHGSNGSERVLQVVVDCCIGVGYQTKSTGDPMMRLVCWQLLSKL